MELELEGIIGRLALIAHRPGCPAPLRAAIEDVIDRIARAQNETEAEAEATDFACESCSAALRTNRLRREESVRRKIEAHRVKAETERAAREFAKWEGISYPEKK